MRERQARSSVALAVSFLALATSAVAESPPPWLDGLVGVTPLAMEAEEALARHVAAAFLEPLPTAEPPASLLSDAEPRMIFASVSDGEGPARVLRGAGEGAAEALRRLLDRRGDAEGRATWVKVDVVREVVRRAVPDLARPLALPRSLWGLAFERQVSLAFLPEQLVAHTLLDSDQKLRLRSIGKLEGKAAVERLNEAFRAGSISLYRFSTGSYFADGGDLIPLSRGHRSFAAPTPELLLDAARRAGDYLVRAVGADGRFVYSYLPKTNREKDKYNILRHAGAAYSMLELFEVTGDRELLAAAERALALLKSTVEPCEVGDVKAACVVEDDAVKLGGNALAIVALAKHAAATGRHGDRPLIERLGRFLVAVQSEAGEFTVHKRRHPTGETLDFTSLYYPGEALLALVRGGGGREWLDAAEKGARWLIEVRDRDLPVARLEHDHWLLYALNELHRQRPNRLYLQHASRITEAILGLQNRRPQHPDWLGSYYRPPRSTPTATRSEGLAAAYLLARDVGDAEALPRLLEGLELGVRFQLQTQFAPESVLYLRDPQRALGGFHRSLTDFEIRIDYVQHNLSSLLLLRRILLESRPTPPERSSLDHDGIGGWTASAP